tara:strand:+ start:2315 stop:2647 length:333 start_codon:yes stop_codon:yes gene_type:complete
MAWTDHLQNFGQGALGSVIKRREHELREEEGEEGQIDALSQCQDEVRHLREVVNNLTGGTNDEASDGFETPDYGGFDAFSSGTPAPPPTYGQTFNKNLKRGLQDVFRRQR